MITLSPMALSCDLFRSIFYRHDRPAAPIWEIPIDLLESTAHYRIVASLPGSRKETLSIQGLTCRTLP
jgi:HSP20 family molecular chaperone IbpA